MDDASFHIWALVFQGTSLFITFMGFVVIFYRIGRYTGTNDTLIQQLFIYHKEGKQALDKHQDDDDDFKKEVRAYMLLK